MKSKQSKQTKAPTNQKKPQTIDEVLEHSKTFSPVTKTILEITEKYALSKKNTDSGGNDYGQKLLVICKRIIEDYENRPFQFEDFLVLSANADTDVFFLKMEEFFSGWIMTLKKYGRITVIDGCYNAKVYTFI